MISLKLTPMFQIFLYSQFNNTMKIHNKSLDLKKIHYGYQK